MVVTEKNLTFNTFDMPLNFLSDIYNGKISLKEAEVEQRNLDKKIEELNLTIYQKRKKKKKK